MRKIIIFHLVTLFWLHQLNAQSIGINATGNAPDASAMLDVSSNEKGLLIPRLDIDDLTTAAPVTLPVVGLMAFNTNIVTGLGLYYWDGNEWVRFMQNNENNNWTLEGNAGTDPATNFIGTTDNVDWVVRTNDTERLRVLANGNVGIGESNPISKLHLHDGSFVITNNTGLQGSIYTTDGGAELYRDPTSAIANNVNGYIDFKDNPADDYDVRIFYNNTLGNNGGFVIEGSTDGQPGTSISHFTVLNENGNVGIGTVTPASRLHINGTLGQGFVRMTNAVTNPFDILFGTTFVGYTNAEGIVYYEVGGAETHMFGGELIPDSDGNWDLGKSTNRWRTVYAQNGTIQTSDMRLKKEVNALPYGLKEVMQLTPITFKWENTTNSTNNPVKIGFSAQNLMEIIPEVVQIGTDEAKTLGVYYSDLIPVLTRSIQEQQAIIIHQQQTLDELKNELNELKKLILYK